MPFRWRECIRTSITGIGWAYHSQTQLPSVNNTGTFHCYFYGPAQCTHSRTMETTLHVHTKIHGEYACISSAGPQTHHERTYRRCRCDRVAVAQDVRHFVPDRQQAALPFERGRVLLLPAPFTPRLSSPQPRSRAEKRRVSSGAGGGDS